MKKKNAFTLAEVLITLGIIGIVAAMTLPLVVSKYRKQVVVSHLKKFYNTMNQAIKRSEVDNGEYQYWQSGKELGGKAYFDKYWAPYLKGFSICETYSACMYSSKQPFKDLKGKKSGALVVSEDSRTTIMLPDGTVVINFVAMGGDPNAGIDSSATSVMYVDINGGKAPNIFGKDVFIFRRNGKGFIEPEGINGAYEVIQASCSKESVDSEGTYCAAKIIKDGWEIKDDYPW